MIETTVYARLSASTALAALVGARVYPDRPAAAVPLPFVIYTVGAGDVETGTGGEDGVERYDVQIEIWGVTQSSANAVAAAVKRQLHRWQALPVQGCFWKTGGTVEADEGYQALALYSLYCAAAAGVPDALWPAGFWPGTSGDWL